MAKPVRAAMIKRRVSLLMFIIEIIVFVWRISIPGILDSSGIARIVYLLLVLSLLPLVTVIGWYGASLTFPIEEE